LKRKKNIGGLKGPKGPRDEHLTVIRGFYGGDLLTQNNGENR